MTREEAKSIILKEAECVTRQGKTGQCCRDELGCGACPLVMEDVKILEAYLMACKALEEPKQGEWIREVVVEEPRKNKRAYARCSACDCRYNHYGVAVKHFDFCPKCGARMKEGDEK